MRKFAVYIFPFFAVVATVLLIIYYQDTHNSKNTNGDETVEQQPNDETTILPISQPEAYVTPPYVDDSKPTYSLDIERQNCVETETEACYVSIATGLTFAYPKSLGTLLSKTRYEYLHYPPSPSLDSTDYDCMYEDISSADGTLMVSLDAGGIGNGNCLIISGSNTVSYLDFYSNGTKIADGRIEAVQEVYNANDLKSHICKINYSINAYDPFIVVESSNLPYASIKIRSTDFKLAQRVLESAYVDLNNANPSNFDTVNTIDFTDFDGPETRAVFQSYIDNGFIKTNLDEGYSPCN